MSYSPGNTTNTFFNKSPANVSKLLMLTFLGVQAVRQLIQVNQDASPKTVDGKDVTPAESRAGQTSAWFTIMMTLLIGVFLYQKQPAPLESLVVLFAAAMGSGVALIYDYITNKTQSHSAERHRMWFGIAHVIFALLILGYLLMVTMG
jgi:uncharacterized membrane-anchored protein